MYLKPLVVAICVGLLSVDCVSQQSSVESEAKRGLEKAWVWLKQRQLPGGAWPAGDGEASDFSPDLVSTTDAMVALACSRGAHQHELKKGLAWLAGQLGADGKWLKSIDSLTAYRAYYALFTGADVLRSRRRATRRALEHLRELGARKHGWSGVGGSRSGRYRETLAAIMAMQAGCLCVHERGWADFEVSWASLSRLRNPKDTFELASSVHCAQFLGVEPAGLQQALRILEKKEPGELWPGLSSPALLRAVMVMRQSSRWGGLKPIIVGEIMKRHHREENRLGSWRWSKERDEGMTLVSNASVMTWSLDVALR